MPLELLARSLLVVQSQTILRSRLRLLSLLHLRWHSSHPMGHLPVCSLSVAHSTCFRVVIVLIFWDYPYWEFQESTALFRRDLKEFSRSPVSIVQKPVRGDIFSCFSFWCFGHNLITSVDLWFIPSAFWTRRCGSSVVQVSESWCARISGLKQFYLRCIKGKLDLMSPSGHSVASFPNWVLYSHAGPVGTTEDLLSQHCMQIRVVSQKIVVENPNKC